MKFIGAVHHGYLFERVPRSFILVRMLANKVHLVVSLVGDRGYVVFAEGALLVPRTRGVHCLVEALRLLLIRTDLGNWGCDVTGVAVFVTHQLVVVIAYVCKVCRGLSTTTSTQIVRGVNALSHSGLTSTATYRRRQRYRQAVIASCLPRVIGEDVLELGVKKDRVPVGPAGGADAQVASASRSVAHAWRVGSHSSSTVLRPVCPLAARRQAGALRGVT